MFYSTVCWNTADAVDRNLKNMNRKSSKLIALKENISIRVIGLGWEDLSMHWSSNVKAFTLEELASHIKMILSNQRSHSIPTKPPVLLPAQKALPQLGIQAPGIFSIDADRIKNSDEFDHQERRTRLDREVVGAGDRYSNMQPTSAPAIDKYLIRKWLDICLQYFLDDGGTELR